MKRNKSWMAIGLLALSASAAFAQTRYISNAPGTWKPWHFTAYGDDQRDLGARPADLKELEAQLLRLNAIIKKTDGIRTRSVSASKPRAISTERGDQERAPGSLRSPFGHFPHR